VSRGGFGSRRASKDKGGSKSSKKTSTQTLNQKREVKKAKRDQRGAVTSFLRTKKELFLAVVRRRSLS